MLVYDHLCRFSPDPPCTCAYLAPGLRVHTHTSRVPVSVAVRLRVRTITKYRQNFTRKNENERNDETLLIRDTARPRPRHAPGARTLSLRRVYTQSSPRAHPGCSLTHHGSHTDLRLSLCRRILTVHVIGHRRGRLSALALTLTRHNTQDGRNPTDESRETRRVDNSCTYYMGSILGLRLALLHRLAPRPLRPCVISAAAASRRRSASQVLCAR